MFDSVYHKGSPLAALTILLLLAATAAPTVWFFSMMDPVVAKDAFASAAGKHGIAPATMQQAFAKGPPGLAGLDNLLTAAFLHIGYDHLVFNMVPLAVLGWMTARRVGSAGFLALWVLGLVVTGLLYGMAGGLRSNMIGASGGTHWLMGLWINWAMADRQGPFLQRAWPSLLLIAFVIVANGVVIWFKGLGFAWDLHLLAVIAGMAAAPLVPARQPVLFSPRHQSGDSGGIGQ